MLTQLTFIFVIITPEVFRIAKKLSFNYDGTDNTMNGWSIISCDKLLMERNKFEVDGKLTMTAKLNVRLVFK